MELSSVEKASGGHLPRYSLAQQSTNSSELQIFHPICWQCSPKTLFFTLPGTNQLGPSEFAVWPVEGDIHSLLGSISAQPERCLKIQVQKLLPPCVCPNPVLCVWLCHVSPPMPLTLQPYYSCRPGSPVHSELNRNF